MAEADVANTELLDALPGAHRRGSMRSIVYERDQRSEHGGLVTAPGADFQHAAAAVPPSSSASVMRATMYGWEMVWPKPIGSAVSS